MSEKIEDGGPVFPQIVHETIQEKGSQWGQIVQNQVGGLTKRELFAAMAMQGFAACPDVYGDANMIAKGSVELADALLAKLRKDGE